MCAKCYSEARMRYATVEVEGVRLCQHHATEALMTAYHQRQQVPAFLHCCQEGD